MELWHLITIIQTDWQTDRQAGRSPGWHRDPRTRVPPQIMDHIRRSGSAACRSYSSWVSARRRPDVGRRNIRWGSDRSWRALLWDAIAEWPGSSSGWPCTPRAGCRPRWEWLCSRRLTWRYSGPTSSSTLPVSYVVPMHRLVAVNNFQPADLTRQPPYRPPRRDNISVDNLPAGKRRGACLARLSGFNRTPSDRCVARLPLLLICGRPSRTPRRCPQSQCDVRPLTRCTHVLWDRHNLVAVDNRGFSSSAAAAARVALGVGDQRL